MRCSSRATQPGAQGARAREMGMQPAKARGGSGSSNEGSRVTTRPRNSTARHPPERTENTCPHGQVYTMHRRTTSNRRAENPTVRPQQTDTHTASHLLSHQKGTDPENTLLRERSRHRRTHTV